VSLKNRIGQWTPSETGRDRNVRPRRIQHNGLAGVVWEMYAPPRASCHTMAHRHELRALGANYVQSGWWRGFAVTDGNLLTGQENFSGFETAETLVRAFGK
jgi:putative intracellular protease/amidase